ncbi:P-loop containing nucleoside triphosphate hydrolase protein [Daedaleopsis nitida]|nr:P-loop containing nucleoside triphosphate hydrolase protein [Daedaleopsis nitida]
MSASAVATQACYIFDSPEGFEKVRSTVKDRLPYVPHDYQLEGVCKLLDGHDLIAVLPTGAGKTGYFLIYILMLLALAENPRLCHPHGARVAPDPCIVVVYPTNGLEEEQASVFENSRVSTVVINAGTLKKARESTPPVDLWTVARRNVAVILLSPEMLTSSRFDSLLEHPDFESRVCALAIDEIHLLYSWGQNFRQSFRQLGLVRARFPMRTRLIGTTATLLAGHTQSTILSFLGLEKERFHFIRRSNIRHNVQTMFRTITHGLGGWDFPDLDWILRDGRRTVIHCRTITLCFRVALYLWHLCPPSNDRVKRIRLYNALNWPMYNAESRRLMKEDAAAQIIVATAAFMVGIDLPNIEDVVIVGNLVSADEHVQWEGRPGRNPSLVSHARCLTYVTKRALVLARSLVDGKTEHGTEKTRGGKKKLGVHMEISMARLLLAPCVTAEQNILYANPPSDPLCLCTVCTLARTQASTTTIRIQCMCSSCTPEDPPASLIPKRGRREPCFS